MRLRSPSGGVAMVSAGALSRNPCFQVRSLRRRRTSLCGGRLRPPTSGSRTRPPGPPRQRPCPSSLHGVSFFPPPVTGAERDFKRRRGPRVGGESIFYRRIPRGKCVTFSVEPRNAEAKNARGATRNRAWIHSLPPRQAARAFLS